MNNSKTSNIAEAMKIINNIDYLAPSQTQKRRTPVDEVLFNYKSFYNFVFTRIHKIPLDTIERHDYQQRIAKLFIYDSLSLDLQQKLKNINEIEEPDIKKQLYNQTKKQIRQHFQDQLVKNFGGENNLSDKTIDNLSLLPNNLDTTFSLAFLNKYMDVMGKNRIYTYINHIDHGIGIDKIVMYFTSSFEKMLNTNQISQIKEQKSNKVDKPTITPPKEILDIYSSIIWAEEVTSLEDHFNIKPLLDNEDKSNNKPYIENISSSFKYESISEKGLFAIKRTPKTNTKKNLNKFQTFGFINSDGNFETTKVERKSPKAVFMCVDLNNCDIDNLKKLIKNWKKSGYTSYIYQFKKYPKSIESKSHELSQLDAIIEHFPNQSYEMSAQKIENICITISKIYRQIESAIIPKKEEKPKPNIKKNILKQKEQDLGLFEGLL